MTAAAWLTLAVICGFVWGGFLVLLFVAMTKERGKDEDEPRGLWVP